MSKLHHVLQKVSFGEISIGESFLCFSDKECLGYFEKISELVAEMVLSIDVEAIQQFSKNDSVYRIIETKLTNLWDKENLAHIEHINRMLKITTPQDCADAIDFLNNNHIEYGTISKLQWFKLCKYLLDRRIEREMD